MSDQDKNIDPRVNPPRVDSTSSYASNSLPPKYVPTNPLRPSDMLGTRTVRIKSTGDEALINASDFDPELHEEPGAKKVAGTGAAPELEALTVAQLTALAQAKKVDLGEASKKAEIIAALVAAGVTSPS